MTFRPETAENPVPITLGIQAAGRLCSDVEFLLGPKGPIAQHMPDWEDRPQQRQLAQCLRRALKQRKHALMEGGTGTGKSVANLVPLILHALETKRPVVVSTHTLALQHQYCAKDLPQLQQLLTPWLEAKFGRTFTFAKQMGRGNYLCEAKPYGDFPEVAEWREDTLDGDLGTLPLDAKTKAAVTASKEECPGSRCRLAGECWFLGAKRAVRDADVIVVSHALLLASLRALPGTVLPLYDALVVDEAHRLEEEATKSLGVEVGPGKVSRLAARALQFCGANRQGMLGMDEPNPNLEEDMQEARETMGLPPLEGPRWRPPAPQCAACPTCGCRDDERFCNDCACECHDEDLFGDRTTSHSPTQEAIDSEVKALFRALTHAHRSTGNQGEARLQDLTSTTAGEHLNELTAHLRRLAVDVENVGEQHWEESSERATADTLSGSLRELAAQLTGLTTPQPGRVAWLAMGDHPALHAAPIDVADYLKDTLWKTPSGLSSATLATGTGDQAFSFAQESLGVNTLHQVVVGSPFKWEKQAWLYLPEQGNHEGLLGLKVRDTLERERLALEYARVQSLHLNECLNLSKGRALLLFTSQKGLDQTRDALVKQGMRWPHVTQAEMSRADALDWFRSTPGAVLFGLSTFFEGVDVQGDALSLLYIDRLPFPPPTDLLWQARLDRAGGGVGAFNRLTVPLAITKMKQGVGRLIRSATDRGLVVLGDPRLQSKAYGATILAALPPARRIHRADLRRLPLFLAGAGVPCEGPAEVAAALQGLSLEGMTREHAQIVVRLREMLPGRLTSGLWGVAEKLIARYRQ